jgi:sugar phosphate isomerase/epimerase
MSAAAIYASTACLPRQFPTLGAQLAAMTAAGLDAIELGYSPPLADLALPRDLGRFPARYLVHNYFPAPTEPFVLNLASQHATTLSRSREFCHTAIELSAALGAPFYSVHCGFLAELDPSSLGRKLTFADVTDYERGYATFVESLQELVTVAEHANIVLAVEPNVVAAFNLIEGRNALLMLAEPREFFRLLKDFSGRRLGVLLDLGHLNVSATTLGFAHHEFVEAVAPRIAGFHVHDNDGVVDQHRPIAADSWVLEMLRQPRFAAAPIVVEAKFPDTDALARHCIWLKKSLNR